MNADLRAYFEICKSVGARHKVPAEALAAVIRTESGGNPYAIRFEPGWKYFLEVDAHAKLNHQTYETEKTAQATSWGLTQIMGSVARQYGYRESIAGLVRPELNIEIGARHLSGFWRKYGNMQDAVAAYNAGSPRRSQDGRYENQGHIDRFMGHYRDILSELDQ